MTTAAVLSPSSGSSAIDELAEVIGMAAALRLAAQFRGLDLYIKKNYADGDDMVAAIGRQAADQLAHIYGGSRLVIPMGVGTEFAVQQLAATGQLSRFEIAQTLNIRERRVYEILARTHDTRQGSLFPIT